METLRYLRPMMDRYISRQEAPYELIADLKRSLRRQAMVNGGPSSAAQTQSAGPLRRQSPVPPSFPTIASSSAEQSHHPSHPSGHPQGPMVHPRFLSSMGQRSQQHTSHGSPDMDPASRTFNAAFDEAAGPFSSLMPH